MPLAQPIDEPVDHLGQVGARPLGDSEDGVADVLQRVGGQVLGEHAAERIRIARRSPQRLEPDIVTHVHLRARPYERGRPRRARSLAITLQNGQSVRVTNRGAGI
jgi:hypothetical protein